MTLGLTMFGWSGLLSLLLSLLLLEVSSLDEELSLGLFLKLNALSRPLSLASAAVASAIANRVAVAASQRDGEVG